MKILIVDNEPTICHALKFALEKRHRVVVCHNTLDALQHVKNASFDLIILDFHMDVLNGADLLKILRQNQNNMNVIILTSRLFKKEEIGQYHLEGYPIISKDDSLKSIISAIHSYTLNHSLNT